MKKLSILFLGLSFFSLNLFSITDNYNSLIVVGGQFGDEGKGKFVDFLSSDADYVVRAAGGNNAGHTIVIGEKEFKLHLTPSGILSPKTQCVLGGGVVIDPEVFLKEIAGLEKNEINIDGRLWISPHAHIILPYHKQLDLLIEKSKGEGAIGTTGRGIGPCYADKVHRIGIRVADLIDPIKLKKILSNNVKLVNEQLENLYKKEKIDFETLYQETLKYSEIFKKYVKEDLEVFINSELAAGKKILFEGAQGAFLDTTFGTYPFVTSSCTLSSGVCAGSGVGPTKINHTLAIMKSFMTRVGNGPMPTEIPEKEEFFDAVAGREFGTTTGRKRRIGWFDAVLAKTSIKLNGADSIVLTKLDLLDDLDKIKICVGYKYNDKVYDYISGCMDLSEVKPVYIEVDGWKTKTSEIKEYAELPENFKLYVKKIEELCETTASILSVGPRRDQTIFVGKNIF